MDLGGDFMKDINIAGVILENRKHKGITQDELARYIGVSKASVSKWETGQSYPDITFLPQLATFFNISIDDLMDYKPQMTKEDIRKLYLSLSNDFSRKPFNDVIVQCREIIKKYFSCYPLILQMGLILFNNSNLANDKEEIKEIILEAKELFVRVKTESDDVELKKQALYLEAMSLSALGLSKDVIKLLDKPNSVLMSSEILLAKAHEMNGDITKAKEILQIEIYQYLLTLLQLLQSYLSLSFNDKGQFDEISKRIMIISKAFNLETLKPEILLTLYLTMAQGNIITGNAEKALEYIEEYSEIATRDIYLLKLKGDEFFNLIENWFESFPIGTNLPRDEKIIRRSMYEVIAYNPIFSTLEDNSKFKNIIRKIKNNY